MNRPHVIVNCAISADGKTALSNRRQLHISCEEDIKRVYMLRNECDAVLVGIGTVISDDPKLTVKEKYVKNPHQPIRIVLDTNCKTPDDAQVVNNVAKTLIFTSKKHGKKYGDNVEIIESKTDENGFIDLQILLELLYKCGIKKLLVEGGGTVIWEFLRQKLIDDLYVYTGPVIVGGKNTPTMADGKGIDDIKNLLSLEIVKTSRLGSGLLIHYKIKR
jgi:2,5-diamino-6-(ribosylamino)-4(3H)-pyrimidinone 5'-phosphate reductase